MHRLVTVLVVPLAIAMLLSSASADPQPDTRTARASGPFSLPSAPEEPRQVLQVHGSYRSHLLLADVLAYGLFAGGLTLGINDGNGEIARGMMITGLLAIPIAAPTVHSLHDEPTRALVSLGLRTVVPVVSTILVTAISSGNCQNQGSLDDCALGNGVTAGLVVLLLGQIYDYTALGAVREIPATPKVTPSPAKAPGLSWQPMVTTSPQGGASLGLAGRW